ncbi:MAG TPA: histidine kinase [Intrasporangium sp.]|uniref:sensor histidine kinase n=1 Tax=Intrasporangium sp. TaxID=1925024 RepID=UPI002B49B5F1|nr:histidine kinase [Intrasporangium sp.]HKX68858.1 histidine kinase [Intrasporangium sp.]
MGREHTPLRRISVLADVALAVVLAALLLTTSVSAVRASDATDAWRSILIVGLVVLHTTVLSRSRWPVASFGVASATMLLFALAPDLGGASAAEVGSPFSPLLLPSGLVYFVLLYTVSSRTTPPLPHVALAVGAIGGIITVAKLWDAGEYVSTPGEGAAAWRLFITAAVAAGLLAAWALGRYRATRLAWVAALEERAVRAERERLAIIEQARRDLEHEAERAGAAERRRIAREMHDVVAHSLAVVVGQAEGGRMLVASEPSRATEVLSTIAEQGRLALTEMRSLLGVLREDHEASRTPQPGLDELGRVIDDVRRTGTTVELVATGEPVPLSPTADLTAFRVVQESLTNIVKHAPPGSSARVALDWSARGLRIRVEDDGADAQAPDAPGPRGRGLIGMRERLALVGGRLERAGPDPSGPGGFVVEARIPAPDADRPGAEQPDNRPGTEPPDNQPDDGGSHQ